jgi:hypothetical protein
MFQQVFHQQSSELLVLPLIALFLFIGVFFAQVVRIWRAPRNAIARQENLPLEDDLPVAARTDRDPKP